MKETTKKELIKAACEALNCRLDDTQTQELLRINEGYLAYQRPLSKRALSDYYLRLSKSAKKVLDILQDKTRDLSGSPELRAFLGEYVFSNVIREVGWVIHYTEQQIKIIKLIKDPAKLADVLESGTIRIVPHPVIFPKEISARIRQKKKEGRGRQPNARLHLYVSNMAKWYSDVMKKRRPGERNTRFLNLLKDCLAVIDKNRSIGEKMIQKGLKLHL